MNITKTKVSKVAAILIVGILFLGPANFQPCHDCDLSKDRCCCCESCCHSLQHNDKDKRECFCQIGEGSKPESSSFVIVTHPDNKPKIDLVSVEVEFFDKSRLTQLADLGSYNLILLSRDPPLYLLNSAFLI